MNITDIDKNFIDSKTMNFDYDTYLLPKEPFKVYGSFYDEELGFIKMPMEVCDKVNDQTCFGSKCTDGVRVLFSTSSEKIGIRIKYNIKCRMSHMAFTGSIGFVLKEVIDGREVFIKTFIPSNDDNLFFEGEVDVRKGMKNYILYLPLYGGVEKMEILLEKGSIVNGFEKYEDKFPILYYGSSITQGGCASRSDNTYQALISEWMNRDYFMFGISGNALGEKTMSEYLSTIDCSIFVMDYDYNAPTAEHLRRTHLEFYKTFRNNPKQKKTPIVFISKPNNYDPKDTEERIEIIKKTYEYAKMNGDDNVYFIDGRTLFPEDIKEHCTVDGCHPTDLGFYFFAKKVFETLKRIQ